MHRFQPAHESDLPAIRQLLRDNGLPCDDLEAVHLHRFQIATDPADGLVACVGLEIHGDVALLRSLAVAAPHRRHGLGDDAVIAAECLASSLGVRRIYLLTMTAANFFDARGYRRHERASAPPALQRTTEFSTLCPASAACMAKNLTPPREVFRDQPDL